MSYYASLGQPGWFPGGPGGLPGPISRAAGPVGPTMPTSIFPTHTRVGDVVTITGPFGALGQGQVRVRFNGTSWLSPRMMGPATASVVVPAGAQTGVCEVEIGGRRVAGANCVIDRGTQRIGRPSHKGRSVRAWTQKGELMGYIPTGAASRAVPSRTRSKPADAFRRRLKRKVAQPVAALPSKPLRSSPLPGSSLSTGTAVKSWPVSAELPKRFRPGLRPRPAPVPVPDPDPVEDMMDAAKVAPVVTPPAAELPTPVVEAAPAPAPAAAASGGSWSAGAPAAVVPFDIPEEMLEPGSPPPPPPGIPWKKVGLGAAGLALAWLAFDKWGTK